MGSAASPRRAAAAAAPDGVPTIPPRSATCCRRHHLPASTTCTAGATVHSCHTTTTDTCTFSLSRPLPPMSQHPHPPRPPYPPSHHRGDLPPPALPDHTTTVVNTPTISTPTEADTPPPLTCVTPAVADADARQRHHQECLQQQNHLGERAGHGTQRDGLAGVAGRFVERGGRGETERWGVGAAFCQVRKNMFKSAREEM